MKKKLTLIERLKLRWKVESPKLSKALGKIALVIVILGATLEATYTSLPDSLVSFIPENMGVITAFCAAASRLLLQFTVVDEVYKKNKKILIKNKNK